MIDYYRERQDLFERIKDSATALNGAERKIENLCLDYEVFCLRQPRCPGLRNYCPAHEAGMKTVDEARRSRF